MLMRAFPECVPCLLRQTLRAARLAKASDPLKVLKEVVEALARTEWEAPPMELGFVVYSVIRRSLGDPYADIRRRSNRVVLPLLPRLREYVIASEDPLETAVRLAVAGNIVDYGALDRFSVDPEERIIEDAVERALKAKPRIYDYERLRDDLESARTVMIVLDNAGEIVFDKLLAETISSELGPRKFVFVVRSVPFINDATLSDAEAVGLTKIPGAEVRTMRCGTLEEYREFVGELETWIEESDVVISKGQGNFELLSDYKGMYFLLTVKCEPIASYLGAEIGDIVVKYS